MTKEKTAYIKAGKKLVASIKNTNLKNNTEVLYSTWSYFDEKGRMVLDKPMKGTIIYLFSDQVDETKFSYEAEIIDADILTEFKLYSKNKFVKKLGKKTLAPQMVKVERDPTIKRDRLTVQEEFSKKIREAASLKLRNKNKMKKKGHELSSGNAKQKGKKFGRDPIGYSNKSQAHIEVFLTSSKKKFEGVEKL